MRPVLVAPGAPAFAAKTSTPLPRLARRAGFAPLPSFAAFAPLAAFARFAPLAFARGARRRAPRGTGRRISTAASGGANR